MSVTAFDIKKALSARHAADFFTTECMSGPSGRGVYRFDAVAIAKSWTHPTITGYEVKVSRSDFKADAKFYAYLPYFHELYIACPKGMIQREELPESIGLIWYNPETGEARAKKRAVYRDIEIDPAMLLHIFYSHMRSDRTPFCSTRAEWAKRYIQGIADNRSIGSQLGSKMAEEMETLQKKLASYSSAGRAVERLKTVENVLHNHGIWAWDPEELAKDLDDALKKSYPPDLDRIIDHLSRVTGEFLDLRQVATQAGEGDTR